MPGFPNYSVNTSIKYGVLRVGATFVSEYQVVQGNTGGITFYLLSAAGGLWFNNAAVGTDHGVFYAWQKLEMVRINKAFRQVKTNRNLDFLNCAQQELHFTRNLTRRWHQIINYSLNNSSNSRNNTLNFVKWIKQIRIESYRNVLFLNTMSVLL